MDAASEAKAKVSSSPIRKRYPFENGRYIIELRVNTIHQLFDERDPAPFRDKDLDEDLFEYLVTAAQDVSIERVGRIRIYIDRPVSESPEEMIRTAFRNHFLYEGEITGRKIDYTLRVGLRSLIIGFMFLSVAVLASTTIGAENPGYLSLLLKEGVLLLGWVSMWKPINIFLYEWWPLADLRSLYGGLADLPIEFVIAK
jgi:hypothetical protein